eukprot:3569219-Ditylum_brightwellii.AAC.1
MQKGKERHVEVKEFEGEQEREDLLQQSLISNENKIWKNSCSNHYPKSIKKLPLIKKFEKDQHDHIYPIPVRWRNMPQ